MILNKYYLLVETLLINILFNIKIIAVNLITNYNIFYLLKIYNDIVQLIYY